MDKTKIVDSFISEVGEITTDTAKNLTKGVVNSLPGLLYYGVCKLDEHLKKKRSDSICDFTDGISEQEFGLLVTRLSNNFKGIKHVSVDKTIVHGRCKAGFFDEMYDYQIDFNDYGHLTGNYYIIGEAPHNAEMQQFLYKIHEAIKIHMQYLKGKKADKYQYNKKKDFITYCPLCGKKLSVSTPNYCKKCKKHFL